MTSKKTTRRVLFSSVISLILCVAMLLGTTFAWFTDVAESGINQIIAGNLDVALLDNAGNSVEGDTELFAMPELWEPGAVAYAQLKVANQGTLDLKASLSINYEDVNSIDGHALSEVLKYAIIDASSINLSSREAVLAAAKASANKGALNIYDFSIELQAGEVSDLQTLVIFWEPNANDVDNLYNVNNGKTTSDGQPLQINLGVKVFATQLGGNVDNENDSFGTDYDENAPTIITVGNDSTVYATIADAFAATSSTSFNVSGPIDITKMGDLFSTANQNVTFNQINGSAAAYYDFSSKLALNVNGASITFNGGYIQGMRSNDGSGYGFQHTTGTITYNDVTINDSWTNENNATVVYNDCVFTGTYYVWTYSVPSATFDGCIFDKEDSRAILVYSHGNNPITATIKNCVFYADAKGYTGVPAWTAAVEVDASLISSGATVTIENCTADENYNGIVRDKGGKNAIITVNGNPIVSNQAALEAAIAAGKTDIYLAGGTFTLSNITLNGKTINFTGSKDAIIDLTAGTDQNTGGATLVFDGVTVKSGNVNYKGIAHATSVTYKNCDMIGLQFLYADEVSFTNCAFNSNGAEHSIWTYGADEVSFTDCDFTYGDRAVNCYTEQSNQATVATFTNCTFTKVAGKATTGAIETNSSLMASLTLNINNCSVNEGDLWWVASYDTLNGQKTTVTIDGAIQKSASTQEELKNALSSGTKVEVTLADGTYTIPDSAKGKTLTISGTKDTVISVQTTDTNAGGADMTFVGVTIQGQTSGNYAGWGNGANVHFVDCTFEGKISLYGKNASFTNCVFNNKNDYAVWTWGAEDVDFIGCTFNSGGKALLVYGEYRTADVNIKDCVFNDDDTLNTDKAAIEIGSDRSTDNYNITITNTTVNGFTINPAGISTNSNVWANKNSMPTERLNVVIDGVEVY